MRGRQRGPVGWLRHLSRASVLVMCAVLLTAIQAVLALLNAPLWLRLTGIVLVAAVGVASEVDKMRSKHVEKAEEDALKRNEADAAEKRWLRTARSNLWTWPPPAVSEVNPQLLAGPADRALTEANPPVPAYVRRDADERAAKQLRADGMVLLIGAPSSGVTRTAYELAATEDAARLLLAPYPPLGLKTALDDLDVLSRLEPPVRLVLWLDRIDRFTPSGLTVPMLQECRERSPGLRVVATISSTEYGRWVREERELATTFADPVTVSRQLSEREVSRAQAAHPETDFSEGIAAAFTSTRSLLERMRAGDTNCPFEAEGDDCALARVVLDVALSWTNTGNPRDLTISGLMDLAKYPLHAAAADRAHLSNALAWAAGRVTQGGSLVSLSTTDAGGATVRAHPGLAEIYDAEHSEGPPLPVWIAALDDADGAGDSDTVGRLGYNAHVRGNMAVAQIAWARVTHIDQPGSQWLKRAAAFSREARQLADAIPPLDRLLSLTESSRGVDHQEVAAVLNELGTVMLGLRNPIMARDLFERALPILEKAYGPDHPLVASNLNNLGTAWFDLGDPAKARDLFERALPILEKAYGPDHPLVASTLINLASSWRDLGKPAKARDLYERALTIQEQTYGPWDLKLTMVLKNLGTAWLHLGNPAKARNLIQRALTIQESALAPDHPEVAVTLDSLADAARLQGEWAEAQKLYERALPILEKAYGPEHPVVGTALDDLGTTWKALGQPDKARALHEKALLILQRAFGPDHPEVAMAMCNLGAAWADLGDVTKARELYKEGVRILRANFPDGHRNLTQAVVAFRRVAPDVVILDDGRIVDLGKDADGRLVALDLPPGSPPPPSIV